MDKFIFLKPFLKKDEKDIEDSNIRNVFYPVKSSEVIEAQQRMGMSFPVELSQLYHEIGYGFICLDDKTHINRIMHPSEIADFWCHDEEYEYVDRDIYDNDELAFFHLGGEGDFITIKFSGESKGEIFYFGKLIANSLYEFLVNMINKTNYYMIE